MDEEPAPFARSLPSGNIRKNLSQHLIQSVQSEDYDFDNRAHIIKHTHKYHKSVFSFSSPNTILSAPGPSANWPERFRTYIIPRAAPSPLLSTRSLRQNTINTNDIVHTNSLDTIDESRLLSMWSAGFTIINVYMGLGLLSYPYALSQGGLISFVILALLTIFMSWTGKLLVRCFIRMKPSKRTYPDVGYASLGHCGLYLVSIGIILEFFGILDTNLIFMWDNAQYFITSLQFDDVQVGNIGISALTFILSACVLPTCWILNIHQLSFVSFLGCVCKMVTVGSIVICFVLNNHAVDDILRDHQIAIYPKDMKSLSICLGIFILSFAGHPVLPTVYNSMRDPDRFEVLLDRCMFCLFVIYCIMALFGYLQFAEETEVLITSNLIKLNSDGKGSRVEMVISQIVVVFIVLGLYFQIAPVLSCLAEIPEIIMFNIESPFKQRLFRTVLFLVCTAFSFAIMNELAVLEAITGSLCTMITTVIAPTLFYFAIYKNDASIPLRVILLSCAVLGTVCGVFLLFNDIRTLID